MPSKEAWRRLRAIEGLVRIHKPQPPNIWASGRNEERDAQIVVALNAGAATKDLAAQWHLSRDRIHQIATRNGVDLRARFRAQQEAMHAERRAKARALEAKGLSNREIARKMGVSVDVIQRYVTRRTGLGDGIRRWWAEKTPEERSRLMAERQAQRTNHTTPVKVTKLTKEQMAEWTRKSRT